MNRTLVIRAQTNEPLSLATATVGPGTALKDQTIMLIQVNVAGSLDGGLFAHVMKRIKCEWRQWRASVSDRSGPGGRDTPLFDINTDWTVCLCLEQIVSVPHPRLTINSTTFVPGMHVTNFFITGITLLSLMTMSASYKCVYCRKTLPTLKGLQSHITQSKSCRDALRRITEKQSPTKKSTDEGSDISNTSEPLAMDQDEPMLFNPLQANVNDHDQHD